MPSDKRIYQLIPPKSEETLPILFESPHSGTYHPIDGEEDIKEGRIYPGVDRYVHQLFDFVPTIGAQLLHALFCRCYIDANRAPNDMKPEWFDEPWPHPLAPSAKSKNGIGLVWPKKDGETFAHDDVKTRIDKYYTAYHQQVQKIIHDLKDRHGHALHISCHSAPRSIMKPKVNPRLNYTADIVISDSYGQSADPKIGQKLRKILGEYGYKVLSNDPFQGDELINANGAPHNHIHSLQIEINRSLYMDEKNLRIRERKYKNLKADLRESFIKLGKGIFS